MKIGVVGNSVKIRDETVVGRFLRFLQTEGYEAVLFEKAEDIGGVDALVVLGGDGAILHAATEAARKNIKLIGINYGNLGFLTEYEKEETERVKELLSELREGSCPILRRTMLELEVNGQKHYGLNEVVFAAGLFRGGYADCKAERKNKRRRCGYRRRRRPAAVYAHRFLSLFFVRGRSASHAAGSRIYADTDLRVFAQRAALDISRYGYRFHVCFERKGNASHRREASEPLLWKEWRSPSERRRLRRIFRGGAIPVFIEK